MPSDAVLAITGYVRDNPGCSKADVHHETGCGWATIDRAIGQGAIGADLVSASPRRYRLYVPPPQSGGER